MKNLEASRFLRTLLKRDAAAFEAALENPEAAIQNLLARDPDWDTKNSTELRAIFRKRKRVLILLLAALDYGMKVPLPLLRLTSYLSDFAALAVDVGLDCLMREQGFADSEGVCVLGMGKLGGGELNYSSDIDLIVLFDPARLNRSASRDDNHRRIQRVIRHLVLFLEQPEAEGYIFRTDLRLRPDPSSMPLAVAVEAAVQYYETMGLAWERAAMLKARPIAGDRALAQEFLHHITPFIWRKSLDYASIADIQAIRARALQSRQSPGLDGVNIKLVEGGIREIELYAQSLQLIWGGRIPALRVKPTLEALEVLAQANLITADIPSKLTEAYLYYRRLEHAAQLLSDQQCHTLPESPEHWQDFATLMAETAATIQTRTGNYLRTVQQICQPQQREEQQEQTFSGDDRWLAELGYGDIAGLKAITERWLGGSYRVTATERARRLLEQLLPKILKAFAATAAPDDALARMDKFLEALPAGVQLFSLFAATPELLRHCADIMGNAPRLARLLSSKPGLFEYLLHRTSEPLPTIPLRIPGLEETLDDCRRLAHEVEFRTSVGFMSGTVELEELMQQQSHTAEVIISQSLRALRQHNPKLPKSGFAILALGKLGMRQLMPDSDLDLIFISDPPDDCGNTPFIRLAQRLMNALSVATAEGKLYEVDVRLRPHGDSGTLCSSLDTLEHYYQHEAWLWEFYALSQARLVYADGDIEPKIYDWLQQTQTRQYTVDDLRRAVQDMRPRITAAFPSQGLWDVKHHNGGLMDSGFCRQYLLMSLLAEYPELTGADFARVFDIATRRNLLCATLASEALEAHQWLIRLQAGLRVSGGSTTFRLEDAPPGQCRLLARLSGSDTPGGLETRLQEKYRSIERLYQHLFGEKIAGKQ